MAREVDPEEATAGATPEHGKTAKNAKNAKDAKGDEADVESDGSEAEAPKNVTIRPETPVAPSAGPASDGAMPANNPCRGEVLARPGAAETGGGGGALPRLRRRDVLAQRRLERRIARAQPRRAAA
jgi:hypothetical protein